MKKDKFDYSNAQHAHWRIDELEKDFKSMSECMKQIATSSEKTAKTNSAIKWVLAGGLMFYIIETVGFIEFLKIV